MDRSSLLSSLARIRNARTLRASSFDTSGRNSDAWTIGPGETRVLAELEGPGCITHLWMTQSGEGVLPVARTGVGEVLLESAVAQVAVEQPDCERLLLGFAAFDSDTLCPFSIEPLWRDRLKRRW